MARLDRNKWSKCETCQLLGTTCPYCKNPDIFLGGVNDAVTFAIEAIDRAKENEFENKIEVLRIGALIKEFATLAPKNIVYGDYAIECSKQLKGMLR